jgi:hypothetical protein
VDREQWLADFCQRIGVDPPTPEESETLLALAGVAAHASERPAAPLACWAAGRTGLTTEELLEHAKRVNP